MFPDKCLSFRLELVNDFHKIVLSTFGPVTTLSRRLTMHLNDTSSIALHLKNHSIPKSKFRKNFVKKTAIIAHEIDKL